MAPANKNKRETLKALAATGVAAGAAFAMPGATAKLDHIASGVAIKVYQNAIGFTVLVQNRSNQDRILEAIKPSKVVTYGGAVDLTVLLQDRQILIPKNTTQAYLVGHDNKISSYASWKALNRFDDDAFAAGRVQSVEVSSSITADVSQARSRLHLALVA